MEQKEDTNNEKNKGKIIKFESDGIKIEVPQDKTNKYLGLIKNESHFAFVEFFERAELSDIEKNKISEFLQTDFCMDLNGNSYAKHDTGEIEHVAYAMPDDEDLGEVKIFFAINDEKTEGYIIGIVQEHLGDDRVVSVDITDSSFEPFKGLKVDIVKDNTAGDVYGEVIAKLSPLGEAPQIHWEKMSKKMDMYGDALQIWEGIGKHLQEEYNIVDSHFHDKMAALILEDFSTGMDYAKDEIDAEHYFSEDGVKIKIEDQWDVAHGTNNFIDRLLEEQGLDNYLPATEIERVLNKLTTPESVKAFWREELVEVRRHINEKLKNQ